MSSNSDSYSKAFAQISLKLSVYLSFVTAFLDIPSNFENFTKNIDYALPIIFYYDHHNSSVQKAITKKIKGFYFGNELTRDKELNFTNVCIFEEHSFFSISHD